MQNFSPEEVFRAISADLRQRGLTHEKAAEKLGFKSRQSLSNLLASKKYLSGIQAVKFQKAFGYNPDFLMRGEGELVNAVPKVELASTSVDTSDLNKTVVALAGMTEIATNLIYAWGHPLAVDAWESLQKGNYEAYRKAMSGLQETLGHKINPSPVLARMICESIEKAEKGGLGKAYFPVVNEE